MLKALKKVILVDTVILDSVCTVESSFQVFKWHLQDLGTNHWVLLSIDHIYALKIKKRLMKSLTWWTKVKVWLALDVQLQDGVYMWIGKAVISL